METFVNKMILQKYTSLWIDLTYILVFTVYLGMAEIFTDFNCFAYFCWEICKCLCQRSHWMFYLPQWRTHNLSKILLFESFHQVLINVTNITLLAFLCQYPSVSYWSTQACYLRGWQHLFIGVLFVYWAQFGWNTTHWRRGGTQRPPVSTRKWWFWAPSTLHSAQNAQIRVWDTFPFVQAEICLCS